MKIIRADKRTGIVEVVPNSFDDLWHLLKIIEKGDLVRGNAERKIKPRDEGGKSFRQKLFVEIEVEGAEFSQQGGLRVSGALRGGKPEEFIEHGAMQSLDVELNSVFKLEKKSLSGWQIDRLKKAEKIFEGVNAIILDDCRADFYLVKDFSCSHLAGMRLKGKGKRFSGEESVEENFRGIREIIEGKKILFLVIAGPGFEKERLSKFISENLSTVKTVVIPVSSVGATGVSELLKSPAFVKAVGSLQLSEETSRVESIFAAIGKNSPNAYGFEDVKKTAVMGAVSELVISESLFLSKRDELERIIEAVEGSNGRIHVISSESEAKAKLDGIGGIAAILRYAQRT